MQGEFCTKWDLSGRGRTNGRGARVRGSLALQHSKTAPAEYRTNSRNPPISDTIESAMSEKSRYADWPTLAKAAADLQISEKTIRRAGVELRHRPAPGRTRPETVVNPRDLQRFLEPAHVMPAEPPPPDPDPEPVAIAPAKLRPAKNGVEGLLAVLTQTLTAPKAPPRPWIPLDEAAEWSGLSPGFIVGRIREGKIVAFRAGPHGALRIRRTSLEAFAG